MTTMMRAPLTPATSDPGMTLAPDPAPEAGPSIHGQAADHSPRTLLQAYLSQRDVPCPGCAHNLRSILLANCPECGMPLYLAIRGKLESTGPQFTRILAMALPLGFNLIFAMLGFIGAMFARSWRDDDWLLLIGFTFFSIVFASGLGWVRSTARAFHQRPHRDQRKRAILTILLALVIQGLAIGLMLMVW